MEPDHPWDKIFLRVKLQVAGPKAKKSLALLLERHGELADRTTEIENEKGHQPWNWISWPHEEQ